MVRSSELHLPRMTRLLLLQALWVGASETSALHWPDLADEAAEHAHNAAGGVGAELGGAGNRLCRCHLIAVGQGCGLRFRFLLLFVPPKAHSHNGRRHQHQSFDALQRRRR